MSQNGGNVESLQMGFKTLTTQIANATKAQSSTVKQGKAARQVYRKIGKEIKLVTVGGSKATKATKGTTNVFAELGVALKDSNGQLRNQEDIFNDTIRKLQQIKNPTRKAILANKVFGRSAAELRPLLNQEASVIDELREKANRLGLIVDEKDIKNAVILKDTFDTFGRVFQARFATVMMKVMPVFTKILEKVTPLIKFITDKIIDLGRQMVATPAFALMQEQFAELADELKIFYYENQDFFDALKTAFVWVVTTGIPNFVTSLILVTRGIVKLVQMVKNFFSWIGGAIGNLVGWIVTIPTNIQTAFINAQNIVLRIFNALKSGIGSAIQYIIERLAKMLQVIGAVASKIPGLRGLGDAITDIGNGITTNTVRQTQNNTTNNNSVVNNYNYGSPQRNAIGGMLQPAYVR